MPKTLSKETLDALKKGSRGVPSTDNLVKARADYFGIPASVMPPLPQTHDKSVVAPSYDKIISDLNELARLNVEAYKDILAEFDLLDATGVNTYEPDELQPIADAVREALNIERKKISGNGGIQISASAPKALSPKSKKILANVKSRAHFENINPDKFYARKT